MTDEQKGHIRRFANNPLMADAVFFAIREAFLKPKAKREVLEMAAERLAVDLLNEARRDIAQYEEKKVEERPQQNHGM